MKLLGGTTLALAFAMGGCAVLHHVEISEIDQRGGSGSKFDIKTSDTGVNVGEAADIGKSVSKSTAVETVWEMITWGPKTGNIVFSDTYADGMLDRVGVTCAPHRLIGIATIRETNKYPVVSGEIVRVIGYCRQGSP